MGEFADDAIDAALNGDWFFTGLRRRTRKHRRPATVKTCAFCGENDLRWGNVPGGMWRLHHKDGSVHVCAEREKAFIIKARGMIRTEDAV